MFWASGNTFKKRWQCHHSWLQRFRNGFHSSGRGIGGVALPISNKFPQNHIPLKTNIQAIAVQIHIRQLITVCSIYLPPNDTLHQHALKSIFRGRMLCNILPLFLILGDFNEHSCLRGSPDINYREQIIEDFITSNCLCILNDGEHTYFHEPSRTFQLT